MSKKRGRPRKMVEDTVATPVAAVSSKPKKPAYVVLSPVKASGKLYAPGDSYSGVAVDRLLETGVIREV